MLALTRRDTESISLITSDGVIVVQVAWAKAGIARLAIQAPSNVAINRTEVHDRILAERNSKGGSK